jgi:hypothetical protein
MPISGDIYAVTVTLRFCQEKPAQGSCEVIATGWSGDETALPVSKVTPTVGMPFHARRARLKTQSL